jgi:hypothetical protein
MCNAPLDRSARRDERLRSDQAAENPRPTVVRTKSTEEVAIEKLQIEALEKAGEVGHPGELARQHLGRMNHSVRPPDP